MIRIGTKIENVQYAKRDGVYAIIERENDNKIAIATDGDYFFLGGGIEEGETEIEALRRELIEESGYSVKNIKYFDKISSYYISQRRGALDKIATFYIAEFDEKVTEPIEKNYKIVWINPSEYKDKLYRDYQRYILDKYVKIKGENNNAKV